MSEARKGRGRAPSHRSGREHRRRKELGQHFLTNPSRLRRILDLLRIEPGDPCLEIGPGRGDLTAGLLDRGATVHAIEIDPGLSADLRTRWPAGGHFHLIEGDARRLDLGRTLGDLQTAAPHRRIRAVGNLPYHSATVILQRFLPLMFRLRDLHFMFQSEVAERIVAPPGGPSFGVLSVLCQLHSRPRIRLRLRPADFRPPPRVRSALVEFLPRPPPFATAPAADRFRRLLHIAFASRRKTLWNNLRAGIDLPPDRLRELMAAADVDPGARPQQLAPRIFLDLCRELPKTVVL